MIVTNGDAALHMHFFTQMLCFINSIATKASGCEVCPRSKKKSSTLMAHSVQEVQHAYWQTANPRSKLHTEAPVCTASSELEDTLWGVTHLFQQPCELPLRFVLRLVTRDRLHHWRWAAHLHAVHCTLTLV